MLKTIEERNCHMQYQRNSILGVWNCYLVKDGFSSGYIKAFLYSTKAEGLAAATAWANKRPTKLSNGRMFEKANKRLATFVAKLANEDIQITKADLITKLQEMVIV